MASISMQDKSWMLSMLLVDALQLIVSDDLLELLMIMIRNVMIRCYVYMYMYSQGRARSTTLDK